MRQSQLFAPTLKEAPKDAEVRSHQVMTRAGMIKQVAAGVYAYLPLGLKVLQSIERIVREEMDALGANELLLPALTPADLWQESGRWDKYGPELMRLKDRKDRDFLLGPTHEEVITYVTRDYAKSYKKLPIALYQIQTKFRDELRPRFALMRGREFSMKDLYTFHTSEEDLDRWYQNVWQAYLRIFKRVGLDVKVVNSDTGQMGGKSAHEFMVMSEVGEDTITYCDTCDYAANVEYSNLSVGDRCPNCTEGKILVAKGIEVGNIFKLGTKYSESMNAKFTNDQGKEQPIIMGCYGLGVSRTLMAIVEQHTYDNGLIWPSKVAPFNVQILVQDVRDEKQLILSEQLYNLLSNKIKVLLDDRDVRLGVKLAESELIGSKYAIIISGSSERSNLELLNRSSKERINSNIEELYNYIVDDIVDLVLK
jgi:prolyl-tRNA synthetase